MSMGPPRCARHDCLPGLSSSAPCTCPPEPPLPSFDLPEHLRDQPPSPIQLWLTAQLDSIARAHAALEDMTMVVVLARSPWLLHHLALQPEWAAYVTQLRASQAS